MAKNKVEIDVKVDDKGTTKKVGLGAKNAAKNLDETAKNAKTADRNIKGTANASSNATKNFSKMSQGMGGLVGAYATLAAQLFAVSAAFNFLKQAGDLKILQQGQVAYSGATGIAMRTLTNDIIAATNAQITFQDASQAAAIGVASGLSPDQLTRLGSAAKNASAILGRDVTDSFNRLVRGVTKAEPELLDELGIILRLTKASEDYALILGKDADALTTFEKSQAVANAVLTQAEDKYGRIMAIMDTGTNRYAKLGKAFDDIVNKFKLGAEKAAGPLADLLIEKPKLALAAIALFLKPVLTAILPGLANVATGTAAVAAQAQASFDAATASAKKYEAALNIKAPKIDPKVAQAGVASSLKGVAPGADKSILAQAQAGKQLNNRQIKALRDTIEKKKLLRGKELTDFKTHLRQMEAANTASNRKMVAEFNLAQQQKAAGLNKFKLKALGVFSFVANAASVAARAISFAFSAIGYVALAASLFMVVKGFLSSGDAAEESAEKVDKLADAQKRLQERVKSVTEDLKFFVDIQNELNSTGNNTEGTVINIAKAFDNYSTGLIQNLNKQVAGSVAMRQELRDLKAGELAMQKLMAKPLPDQRKGRRELQDKQQGIPAAIEVNKIYQEGLEKQLGPVTEYLEQLEKIRQVLNMETDAKLKNSNEGKALNKVLQLSLAGMAVEEGALNSAITNYMNLGKELEGNRRLRAQNLAQSNAIRDKMFPKAEIETYIDNLQIQLVSEQKLIDNKVNATEAQKDLVQGLKDEIEVMKELRDQKIRHAQETRSLGLAQLSSAPDVEFPALRKRRMELDKVAQMELKLQQTKESLATKQKLAFSEGISPTAAQLEEIQKINDEITKQEDLVRRANLALKDGHRITQTLANSFESSMANAFQGIITGTMTVKEAFRSMGEAILNALARVIAELIAVKILQTAVGLFSGPSASASTPAAAPMSSMNNQSVMAGGDFLQTSGSSGSGFFRNGGIATPPRGYSAGGVARGSTSGYPAVLHGTEAVVPLPNGNSIPVEMKGGGGVTNNSITVNVSSDGQTSTQGGKGMDMDKMGVAVAAAVQKELQNQKRSGGILNPYGVA